MTVEELFRLEARERLIQEYTICLIQLKTLKSCIYDWNAKTQFGYQASTDIHKTLNKFIYNEDESEVHLFSSFELFYEGVD